MESNEQTGIDRFSVLLKLFFCKANLVRLTGLIFFFPVSLIARLIPKTDIVVLGARYGKFYDWDPKYIFEYLLTHPDERDYACYWVARSKALWTELKEQGKPVLLLYRPRDVWKVLRARIAVISTSPGDIDLHLISGAKLVHTYHGIPIRKVANNYLEWHAQGLKPGWRRWFIDLCFKFYYAVRVEAKADYIVTTSEGANGIWQSQYNHDPSVYRILGMPRNDALFQPGPEHIKKDPAETIISYLPTFRGNPGLPNETVMDLFNRYGFDAEAFDALLSRHHARLLVKCHHRQLGTKEVDRFFERQDRVFLYQGQDVMPVIKETDILISDYSSVVFHHLLLDRPIIFAPFDFDEYNEVMGFTFDYMDIMPGPKCQTWDEVLQALENYFVSDEYVAARARARDFIYLHKDGNSCQRIARFLMELNREMNGRKTSRKTRLAQ